MRCTAIIITILALHLPRTIQQSESLTPGGFPYYPYGWSSSDVTNAALENCSHTYPISAPNPDAGTFCPVRDCVVAAVPEWVKSDWNSAGVILGLMPTILALLGSATPELALMSSRRPLLTLILVFASPAVNPTRAFEYHDPIEALKQGRGIAGLEMLNRNRHGRVVVEVQLILAGAALANVWQLSISLGKWNLNIACNGSWEKLWVILAGVIHLVGTVAFASRAKFTYPERSSGRGLTILASLVKRAKHWAKSEFTPCIVQPEYTLSWKKENPLFLFCAWFASIITVAHVLYGTYIFAAIPFMGTYKEPCFELII
jgi:hypothetical protein